MIYLLDNYERRQFANAEVMRELGYDKIEPISISAYEFQRIPEGSMITSTTTQTTPQQ